MVILTNSGNSVIKTEELVTVFFQVKFDKRGRIIKRNGFVSVDKKKIVVIYKSGVQLTFIAANEIEGKVLFDTLVNCMKKDEKAYENVISNGK